MSVEISNRQTDQHKIHWKHFVMHSVTAIAVFAAGVGADVLIVHHLNKTPRTVKWNSGEIQTNYSLPDRLALPTNAVPVELGITDDGIMVWRTRK